MQTDVETQAERDGVMTRAARGTRRKILIASLAALTLAGAGGLVSSARAAGPTGDEAREGMPMRRMERVQHKSLRQQLVAALTAPTINAGEVERLRKQSMASADKVSALFTQGMVASAQVLTPEQRKLAGEELAKGRGHRHWGPSSE